MTDLTHFNHQGEAHMVDIDHKPKTNRIAQAKCRILLKLSTLELITQNKIKKGDVFGIARIAGIMASKQTPSLIPLCHSILINSASIEFIPLQEPPCIDIIAEVTSSGKTGVEMEALTAVSVSALTIYDMVKSVDRGVIISETRLIFKDGGKSGRFEVV